jgi:dolichol-phosphate mannosyltransferase
VKISIIVPCYNECATIEKLLKLVKQSPIEPHVREIIVVDDGSTDGTTQILQKLSSDETMRVIYQGTNRGKGSAIRSGLLVVTGDIVIIQDADLENDPNDYPKLIAPISAGKTDVVYGSRYLDPKIRKQRPAGVTFLTEITNLLYDSNITDEPTCYKVFRTNILKSIPLSCVRFEFCPEITAKISKRHIPIHEVQISYRPRTKKEGKKLWWFRDGLEALFTLVKYRFID